MKHEPLLLKTHLSHQQGNLSCSVHETLDVMADFGFFQLEHSMADSSKDIKDVHRTYRSSALDFTHDHGDKFQLLGAELHIMSWKQCIQMLLVKIN